MDARFLARLCTGSTTKYFIPELDVDWEEKGARRADALMPEPLLSISGLSDYVGLGEEQRYELARHEVAALYSYLVRLENVLVQRYSRAVQRGDLSRPEFVYYLHEIEEEARHGRMLIRFLGKLGVGGYSPQGLLGLLEYHGGKILTHRPTFFMVLTLTAEAITDYFHEQWIRLPGIDPTLRRVSTIHRIEEARHIAFARQHLRDVVIAASSLERAAIRLLAPPVLRIMFDFVTPPEVYLRARLCSDAREAWALWWRVSRSAVRGAHRRRALRPVVRELEAIGLLSASSPAWRAVGVTS